MWGVKPGGHTTMLYGGNTSSSCRRRQSPSKISLPSVSASQRAIGTRRVFCLESRLNLVASPRLDGWGVLDCRAPGGGRIAHRFTRQRDAIRVGGGIHLITCGGTGAGAGGAGGGTGSPFGGGEPLQYSGTAGKVENLRVGEWPAFWIGAPKWAADGAALEARSEVPQDVVHTKAQLAQQMITRAVAAGVPLRRQHLIILSRCGRTGRRTR